MLLASGAKIMESLYEIGLSLQHINELLYLDMGSKTLDYGVDVRDSSIQWLKTWKQTVGSLIGART